MATTPPDSKSSVGKSVIVGTAVGTAVLLLYLVSGLLFASWSVDEFLSNLTVEAVGTLLLLGGAGIATFAVPVALYLHARIRAPLAVLCLVVVGWLALGIGSGSIGAGAIFGLSLYAVGLAPLYVALYLVLGGGEYFARKRGLV
ncbi:hypothetical protein [Halostella litorea]|uniref:hypothetical protein n=1 Tax=Halostella litorea TaxID=2528831 RepID=UPI001092BFCD|nr:hypothetical protein [Halostella litorea]